MVSSTNSTTEPTTPAQRVLVVEDEFLIRLTLSEVLSDEGFEVLEAESGDAAVALLDAHTDIAVLLTDVQLPGTLDGRALVRHARQTRPDLPVIYMTGRPDAIADRDGGNEMFIAKPYLPSEICTAVRKMLSKLHPR